MRNDVSNSDLTQEEYLIPNEETCNLIMTNPIRSYIIDIHKYTLLEREEEVELGMLIRSGDLEARKKMIVCNLRLVVSIAFRYRGRYGSFSMMDIINEGNVGLIRAVDKFDPTLGYKFSTYATKLITQAITNAFANKNQLIKMPIEMKRLERKYYNYIKSYETQFRRKPTDELVMKECNLSDQNLKIFKEMNITNILELNNTVSDETDNLKICEENIDRKILLSKIKRILSVKQYYVLYNRVFFEPIKTLTQLGKERNVKKQGIAIIESKALEIVNKTMYSNETQKPKERYVRHTKRYNLSQIDFKNNRLFNDIKKLLTDFEYYVLCKLHFSEYSLSTKKLAEIMGIDENMIKNAELEAISKVIHLLPMKQQQDNSMKTGSLVKLI